jgi:site-specific recombinase XerD
MTARLLPDTQQEPIPARPGSAADHLTATVRPSPIVDSLTATVEKAKHYAEQARARNTKRAYAADWSHFIAFCQEHALDALPATPETLGLYLTHLADTGYKASTLQRRLSALREAHRLHGQPLDTTHPAVREVWRGIRNVLGARREPKAPVIAAELLAMLGTLSDDLKGKRDKALLLFGFASALRRSELVGLDHAPGETSDAQGWIERHPEGIKIRLARSKTDQEGQGRTIGVPYGERAATCPVTALRDWLDAAGLVHGPLFRSVKCGGSVQSDRLSDRAVALIVKRAAEAAGLDPTHYAGHSLRSGHATTVALNDGDERTIQAQLGHANAEMTRRYIREANVFKRSSAGKLGL